MNYSNLCALNRLAQSSVNRVLVSPLTNRLLGFTSQARLIQKGLSGLACRNSGQKFTSELLTSKRSHELTFVRFQFDFNKKPPAPIARKSKWFSGSRKLPKTSKERNLTTLLYLFSLAILTTGASYAAVPLYRIFCQASGYGGTTQVGHDTEKIATMKPKKDRLLKVMFNADTAATMRWNFRPQQPYVEIFPGETALAFYTAKNPTDKPIDGISTYNVIPFEAGQYFNKIQCFCFEEQRLNPNEEVDMPVFFYIDPEFVEDPFLENVDTIFLSYTFFESKPGLQLPTMK